MKNRLILIIGLMTLIWFNVNAQWKWAHPSPQGNTLLELHLVNANTLWASGEQGTLIKSDNGGVTWSSQFTGLTTDIRNIAFADSAHGYIGSGQDFMYTVNGGQRWNLRYRFPSQSISAMYFIDADTGYIAVETNSTPLLYKSVDGGNSWAVIQSNIPGIIREIKFNTSGTGFITGTAGTMLRTDDFGSTWTSIALNTADEIRNVSMVSSQTVYCNTSNEVFKSTDQGLTFISIGNPGAASGSDITSMEFFNSRNGVVACESGNIYTTTDGGGNWSHFSTNAWFDAQCIRTASLTTFYAIGSAGSILKTINGGSSWIDLTTRVSTNRLNAIDVVNASISYAAGNSGTILKTITGGASWTSQISNTNGEDLNDIHFVNPSSGVAVGNNGTVVRTANGGANWSAVTTGFTEKLNAVTAASNGRLIACGDEGRVIFSTNNGTSWTDLPNPLNGVGFHYKDIQVFGTDTIVIMTDQPYFLISNDNGVNWNILTNGSNFESTAMCFVSGTKGYIATSSGEIMQTVDAGNNWTQVYQTLGSTAINFVRFSDAQNGWFATANEIYRTADGAQTWNREINPNKHAIYDMDFSLGNSAQAVGDGFASILTRTIDLTFTLPASRFCTDNTYPISINASGNFNPGNEFIVELSDEFGEFVMPFQLGSITATTSTVIPVVVPNGITDGNNYRIRIVSTDPPSWSPLNTNPLEIKTSPDAIVNSSGPTTFCEGSTVTLNAFTSIGWTYQWYVDGAIINGATTDSLVVTQTGDYTVVVSNGLCNLASPATHVEVQNCSGLAEQQMSSFYSLTPNPARHHLQIRTSRDLNIESIVIADLHGRIVERLSGKSIANQQIDISELEQGTYQLMIRGDQNETLKFVKL